MTCKFWQYSQTWVNNHLQITTTCLQRPPFWSPNLSLYNIKLPLNKDHLSTTATNLGSWGWSLYTSSTVQSNLCTMTTLGTKVKWPLLTGGRCSEVIYVIKALIGASKWWSLWTGGRYSEVVVSSGLTVLFHTNNTWNLFWPYLPIWHLLKRSKDHWRLG